MEVPACNICASPVVQGITLPGVTTPLPVLSLYADDVSFIVSSDKAIEEIFHTYARFEKGTVVVWYRLFRDAGPVVFVFFCSSWLVCLCGSGSIPKSSACASAPRYLS